MKLFNKLTGLFGSKSAPEVVAPMVYIEPTILTPMKWVKYIGNIGVVTDLSCAGVAVIDVVGADGLTIGSLRAPIGEVILAKHLEIPESRRHPDAEYAASLGYL